MYMLACFLQVMALNAPPTPSISIFWVQTLQAAGKEHEHAEPAVGNVHANSCKEGTVKSTYQDVEDMWATLLEEDDDRLEAVVDKPDSHVFERANGNFIPPLPKVCNTETAALFAKCPQDQAERTEAVEYEKVRPSRVT